uniref:Uncharacterized protein n=1 Tax=Tetranychus urticae TaxID=32264 RepID=T1KQ04_TETUR
MKVITRRDDFDVIFSALTLHKKTSGC